MSCYLNYKLLLCSGLRACVSHHYISIRQQRAHVTQCSMVKGRDGRLEGGEQSFLNLIASANQNKYGIKTIGLAKPTPLYRSSQAPCKDPNQATKVPGQLELTQLILGARSHKPMSLVLQAIRGAPTQSSKQNHKAPKLTSNAQ